MTEPLSRRQRLAILAELCPQRGQRRPCDSADLARQALAEIVGPPGRAPFSADGVLMRAIDRYAAGKISLADLYRCRVLAYYLVFASGGEEWARWGVAASVRPGDFAPEPEGDAEPAYLPPGPPWRKTR